MPSGGAKLLSDTEYHRAILISHNRRDPAALNAVYALVGALRREVDPDTGKPFSEHCHMDSRRVELWIDNEQLANRPGDSWGIPILRAMRYGLATVFFVGNAFCGSDNCTDEVQHATMMGFKKIPVFLEWPCS